MASHRFQNPSEGAYAEHLTRAGLSYEYERQWGTRNPDFTIMRSPTDAQPIAIADVKDLNLSDEDEKLLNAGQMISIERNPTAKTRRLIRSVWTQFEACSGYPCILVLAPGRDHLPEPIYAIAAMLGDYTVSIPISISQGQQATITQSFGAHGEMVADNGDPRNTRISAIGLMSAIRPGEVLAGLGARVEELKTEFLSDSTSDEAVQLFLNAYNDLRDQLKSDGYDLDTKAIQVEYVVNPLAATPFPKADLARGYTRVWEYNLASQQFGLSHDWVTPDIQAQP